MKPSGGETEITLVHRLEVRLEANRWRDWGTLGRLEEKDISIVVESTGGDQRSGKDRGLENCRIEGRINRSTTGNKISDPSIQRVRYCSSF